MFQLKWLPWRFILRRAALAHGFLDPVSVLARLQQFAEPSEVAEPIELLRAGVTFHARGLINSRVIQHNLDWVWPYWVHKQFDPLDDAFIPRAFSITHCNLSHRNWTALGWPDSEELPLVDPRGLLTPLFDGWSIDAWVIQDGDSLFPSQCKTVEQELQLGDELAIQTVSQNETALLTNHATVKLVDTHPHCVATFKINSSKDAKLAIALRPFNPEGISFIHDIKFDRVRKQCEVNNANIVEFSDEPDTFISSDYRCGDIALQLNDRHRPDAESQEDKQQRCKVGMATAAALFSVSANESREVSIDIPLAKEKRIFSVGDWNKQLKECCQLQIPDKNMCFLFEAAVHTLILHSPGDVYPGCYTYKRFWFRDAAFILQAMLFVGLHDRVERCINGFAGRQKHNGYFHSQNGEWDSNGEALWTVDQFCSITNQKPKPDWCEMIAPGANWIAKKRMRDSENPACEGLMPAGFSAEHLGPNDNYYWDDFWSVAGLKSAASLLERIDEHQLANDYRREAEEFLAAIDQSLEIISKPLTGSTMPASPHRRPDPGAIGSLAAGYPLQLYSADDVRLRDTVNYLFDHCFVHGGFFQDMIHSGINPYLTLHIAQVMLRAGDSRYFDLMDTVAQLATDTGQWPEAIHPRTGGGCMGDGQHVWAAAEWVAMLRNCFVREEGDRLIIAAGVAKHWLEASSEQKPIVFGPVGTHFGPVTIKLYPLEQELNRVRVEWDAQWHSKVPKIEISLLGNRLEVTDAHAQSVEINVALDKL